MVKQTNTAIKAPEPGQMVEFRGPTGRGRAIKGFVLKQTSKNAVLVHRATNNQQVKVPLADIVRVEKRTRQRKPAQ